MSKYTIHLTGAMAGVATCETCKACKDYDKKNEHCSLEECKYRGCLCSEGRKTPA